MCFLIVFLNCITYRYWIETYICEGVWMYWDCITNGSGKHQHWIVYDSEIMLTPRYYFWAKRGESEVSLANLNYPSCFGIRWWLSLVDVCWEIVSFSGRTFAYGHFSAYDYVVYYPLECSFLSSSLYWCTQYREEERMFLSFCLSVLCASIWILASFSWRWLRFLCLDLAVLSELKSRERVLCLCLVVLSKLKSWVMGKLGPFVRGPAALE